MLEEIARHDADVICLQVKRHLWDKSLYSELLLVNYGIIHSVIQCSSFL